MTDTDPARKALVERLREGVGHELADIASAETAMDEAADAIDDLIDRLEAAEGKVRKLEARLAPHLWAAEDEAP